jgi:hypothetical protein
VRSGILHAEEVFLPSVLLVQEHEDARTYVLVRGNRLQSLDKIHW